MHNFIQEKNGTYRAPSYSNQKYVKPWFDSDRQRVAVSLRKTINAISYLGNRALHPLWWSS